MLDIRNAKYQLEQLVGDGWQGVGHKEAYYELKYFIEAVEKMQKEEYKHVPALLKKE